MEKVKIITHRFENERWGRYHLPFYKKFDEFLSKYFDVESINYNKDGNTFSGHINLKIDISGFGKNPPLSDVDCVIENVETGEIKVLSATEYFNSFVAHYTKSNSCTKILLCHFNWNHLYHWMRRENSVNNLYKVKPWIFFPFNEFDIKHYQKKRLEIKDFNNKMFWQGSGADQYRKTIKILEDKDYLQKIEASNHNVYLEKLINSKIGVSYYLDLDKYNTPFDHPGEFCYRDIEYISLGLPFIRIEYKDTTHNPLLPNYHYISIPREHAYVAYERNGLEGVADLFIETYNNVINDNEFLKYISTNQIKWYEENILLDSSQKLTFELLELDSWVNRKDILNIEKKESNISIKIENEENNIKGNTIYKGYILQQTDNVFDVFKTFISEIKPKQILEIGTAGGGFTLYIRDLLNEIGLYNSEIKTFDIRDADWYDELRKNNIEVNIENLFSYSYTELNEIEKIENFIKKQGTTLILCDGGSKINEFKLLSDLLKVGDYIMAHDYCSNKYYFENKILNKIWNWCEITDNDIEEICEKNNLIKIKEEEFQSVVWTCRKKVKSNISKKIKVKKTNDVITENDFAKLFNNLDNINFIQIGSNDGLYLNPLKNIMDERWSGLLFEPGFEAFSNLCKNFGKKSKLKFINKAVSTYNGKGTLYCGKTSNHYTLVEQKAKDMFDVEPKKLIVEVLSLDCIFDEYSIEKLDLLHIDTQGHDFDIVKTIPFDKVKPKIIRFELVNLNYSNSKKEDAFKFLENYGYDYYISEDGKDIIGIKI